MEMESKSSRIDHHSKGSDSDRSWAPDLPIEILNAIFSKLPVKSLGRCMCVSPSWLSFISSQQFIKTHLAIASGSDDYEHHRLIFRLYKFPNGDSHHRSYPVNFLLYGAAPESGAPKVFDVNHLVKPNELIWPVGSSNGLVLSLTNSNALFLCNPCTKKHKKLPQTGMEYRRCSFANFGLGYDHLNDDYKVVGVFYSSASGTEIKVYSLKNDSWKDVRVRAGVCRDNRLQYAGGNFYWRVSDSFSNDIGKKFARFDLANGSYREMNIPNGNSKPCDYRLGVLGDCLSLCYLYGSDDGAVIWILKDTWTRVAAFPFGGHPANHRYMESQLVCSFSNGDILLVLGSYFLLHNPENDTYESLPQRGTIGHTMLYVESLVSPDAYCAS